MTCDVCGKKKATVHLTEIVDNQMTEMHLCEDCAREKSVQMEQQFGLADLLAGLSDFGKQVQESEKTLCPRCGLSYDDFKKFGRLGCADCYEAFREQLGPLLRRIHGSTQHLGKTPLGAPGPRTEAATGPTLKQLKDQLQDAIQREDFEKAAELRDRIRAMERSEPS